MRRLARGIPNHLGCVIEQFLLVLPKIFGLVLQLVEFLTTLTGQSHDKPSIGDAT
jgi:hypothetical protein